MHFIVLFMPRAVATDDDSVDHFSTGSRSVIAPSAQGRGRKGDGGGMALLNFDGYVILPLTRTGISEILGSVLIVSGVKYPILA
jgi:hypothetical protein